MKERNRELSYRIFVTDLLGARAGLKQRWITMVKDLEKPEETRTAEDVISSITSNPNLVRKKKKEANSDELDGLSSKVNA